MKSSHEMITLIKEQSRGTKVTNEGLKQKRND